MLKKGKMTLRRELLQFLLLGWFIPLAALIVILMFFVATHINRQAERTLTVSMEKAAELVTYSLSDCVSESRDASYLSTLRDAWNNYRRNGDTARFRSTVSLFLEEKYKFNPSFDRTVLVFTEEPQRLYYTQNESVQKNLQPISSFQKNTLPELLQAAENLGTSIAFKRFGGHVYLLRNLVDRSFTPYAVLVMELNADDVFGSLESVPEYGSMTVFCEGAVLTSAGENVGISYADIPQENGTFLFRGENAYAVCHRDRFEGNEFLYAVTYDRDALKVEQRSSEIIFLLFLLFLIPLVGVVFSFFHTRVSRPISELKDAALSIAEGRYGETVRASGQNAEIAELTENFNRMSEKLDEQFNKIFVEEIALRDANIHALQSQINPHFLNNTLEIINWETRMSGNEKASRMIEALSTMMGATMNRDKRGTVPLSEELSYVRAFIYIVSCRYGDRFTYEESIDEALLSVEVPRLIIQPVVENAAEYGVDGAGNRYVGLFVEGSAENLTIRVVNHGMPSREDLEKIRLLLSGKETEVSGSTSIGIRNVNRRLKMLYGDASELTIKIDENGDTISTIFVNKRQS